MLGWRHTAPILYAYCPYICTEQAQAQVQVQVPWGLKYTAIVQILLPPGTSPLTTEDEGLCDVVPNTVV